MLSRDFKQLCCAGAEFQWPHSGCKVVIVIITVVVRVILPVVGIEITHSSSHGNNNSSTGNRNLEDGRPSLVRMTNRRGGMQEFGIAILRLWRPELWVQVHGWSL